MDHSSKPREGDAQSVFSTYDGPVTQIRMSVVIRGRGFVIILLWVRD